MRTIVIDGQKPLHGEVTIQGAKNAAQKMLPATVLWPGTYLLKNIPLIQDARALLTILDFLGAKITFLETHDVQINTKDIIPQEIPPELTALSTGTFLFAGALLGRFGEAKVWHPGGDRIGKRPVTWHLEAFRQLGATVTESESFYHVQAKSLHGGSITFTRPTANGAINAVITAMRAQGRTTLTNVAPEPEIQCALHFFQAMGGHIRWVDFNTIEIEGGGKGTGSGTIEMIPDRNDAATFLLAGVLGHGPVTLHNVRVDHLRPLLELLQRVGVSVNISTPASGQTISVACEHLQAQDLQVMSQPFPGFSTDWGPLFETLLTQLPGTHTFHETIFARRFAHVPELVRMNALIQPVELATDEGVYNFDHELISPGAHAIQMTGPCHLQGTTVHANDVRAGASLVLAGLIAEGHTEVTGVEQIERGYEAFVERLQSLGAAITLQA